ncbi:MAG: hypothetical protein BWY31_00833 [Lentisphaerae bacterium ADurb.Bin242]|nr:MAG: hypothetical protein BWY31_00833 [Lentisphaerae bacterium ADurb.Bin242]
MKKMFIALCAGLTAFLLSAAEYHYGFENVAKDEKGIAVPADWWWYAYFNKDYGTWGLSEDAKEKDFAMRVTSKADAKTYLRIPLKKPFLQAKSGSTVEISFFAKGKGTLGAGLYSYCKKLFFINQTNSDFITVDSPEYSLQKFKLTVPPAPADKEIVQIAPVFNIGKGSSFLIDDLKVVISNK